jgi:hypothetical protein
MSNLTIARGAIIAVATISLVWNGYLAWLLCLWYGSDFFHIKTFFEVAFSLAVLVAMVLSLWLLARIRKPSWLLALAGVVASVAPQVILLAMPR